MGVTYNRSEFDRFRASASSFGEDATRAVIEAISETIEKGAEDVRYVVRESHTTTGLKRQARGGDPGRVDGKDMINAVDTQLDVEGNRYVVGRFGWLDDGGIGYRHAYFQEPGTARVAGMNSIFQAYSLAIRNFKQALADKGFKVT